MTYDLTNSVQRQGDLEKSDIPLWKQVWRETHPLKKLIRLPCPIHIFQMLFLLTCDSCYSLLKVDDRFFWNKHMIQDLIDLKVNYV